jgi:hypothetical protein
LFEKEILSLDALMGAEKREVISFLDRCPAHPTNLRQQYKINPFPPINCTSGMRPLDLGIIRAFKHYYRNNLVQIIISKLEKGGDPKNFKVSVLHKINIEMNLRTSYVFPIKKYVSICTQCIKV